MCNKQANLLEELFNLQADINHALMQHHGCWYDRGCYQGMDPRCEECDIKKRLLERERELLRMVNYDEGRATGI